MNDEKLSVRGFAHRMNDEKLSVRGGDFRCPRCGRRVKAWNRLVRHLANAHRIAVRRGVR